jgi:hypothetical protein
MRDLKRFVLFFNPNFLASFATLAGVWVAVWQLILARRSLVAERESNEVARKREHIQRLPQRHFIIYAKYKTREWLMSLLEAESLIRKILSGQDPLAIIPQLERLGLDSP